MFARLHTTPLVIGVTTNSRQITYATIRTPRPYDGVEVLYDTLTTVFPWCHDDVQALLMNALAEWCDTHDAVIVWSDNRYAVPLSTTVRIPVIDCQRACVVWYAHTPHARTAQPCAEMRIADMCSWSLSTVQKRVTATRDDDDDGHMRHVFFHDQ